MKVREHVLSVAIILRFHVLVNAICTCSRTFYILTKKWGVIMATLYETLSDLCKKRGIKGGRMCTDLGISKSLMTDLKSGRKKGVSATTAQKIAVYFNVSVGYLLGEEEKQKQSTQSELSIKKKRFIKLVEEMTDAQVDRLEQILALVENKEL